MIQTTTTTVSPFQVIDPIIVAPTGSNPLSYVEGGITNLTMGQQVITITFQQVKISPYVFVESEVVNTIDSPVLNLDFDITKQDLDKFQVTLNGTPDTVNYFLHWRVAVPPA